MAPDSDVFSILWTVHKFRHTGGVHPSGFPVAAPEKNILTVQ